MVVHVNIVPPLPSGQNFEIVTKKKSSTFSFSSYATAMSSPNPAVTEDEFSKIESLLEGSDEDKLAARDLLLEMQEQVRTFDQI